jgi:HAD superfamily hydrolase (TIGR01509 family)
MRPDRRDTLPPLPGAVLWDLDGTLVDTEPYWDECQIQLVVEHGGSWNQTDADALVGTDLLTSARYLRRHGGVRLAPTEIVDVLVAGVAERIGQHIPWRPGARELLAELQALAVPCALVTMSYRCLALAVVQALPAGTFTTVVAGDDVTHGKPHPEPYLTAAARLGVAPSACVAIEDSPTGVASAVAAGVAVLGVVHHVPLEASPGRPLTDTLTGVTPGDLARLLADTREATG